MFLPVEGPLDLGLTLGSGQAFRWRPRGEWFSGLLGERPVLLRQVPGGLEFCCLPGQEEEVAGLLHHYLRLDDNLAAVHRSLSRDPVLAQAIGLYGGLRLLRQGPWECLASFVCSSFANIPRITRMVEGLAQGYGRRLELKGAVGYSFPSPEAVAAVGERGLRALGLGYRAPYLARAAGAVVAGDVDLASLAALPYEDARRELLTLPGVGEKVADCTLLYGLGKLEAFPIDLWVRRAVEQWYGKRKGQSYRSLSCWAYRRFRSLAGYAQLYLFYARRSGMQL